MVRRPQKEYWLENEAEKIVVTLPNGAKLRLLKFQAEEPDSGTKNVVFYPGFLSYIYIWMESILLLKKKHNIYFWESREKEFSAFPQDDMNFNMKTLGEDFKLGLDYLNLPLETCVFAGSSIGSVGAIEAMSLYDLKPYLAVFASPQVYYPRDKLTTSIGVYVPLWFIAIVKPLIYLYYHIKFRRDKRSALSRIHTLSRIFQKKQFAWMGIVDFMPEYHMKEEDVENINAPLVIVYGKDDPEHLTDKIQDIKQLLPNAKLMTVPQKKDTHNEVYAKIILDEIEFVKNSSYQ